MNWAEIKAAVADTMWRPETDDSVLDRYTRQALREIMTQRDWLWLIKSQSVNGHNSPTMAAPGDMDSLMAIYIVEDNYRYPLNRLSFTQHLHRWSTEYTGYPLDYATHSSTIYLGPEPDDAYDFELVYRVNADPQSDTWSNPVTEDYPTVLIDAAAGKIMKSYYRDGEAAKNHFDMYQHSLQELEDLDDRRKRDDFAGFIQPDTYLFVMAHGLWD